MYKRSPFSFFRAAVLVPLALACVVADATPRADAASLAPSSAPRPAQAELARLATLQGRWSVRQSLWTDPAGPPAIDQGTATFTAVLGGRHLRQELRIDASGKPFQGLGYLGYDDASGQYDSIWMDVNFGGVIVAHGSYDPARKAYTFDGSVADPKRHGARSPLREVLRMKDADHFTCEYYERHAGREALAVRLEYARLK